MSVWDTYKARAEAAGHTRREVAYKREFRELALKNPDSLSFHHVTIDDIEQDVTIVTSKNNNERRIMSLPGEKIRLGGLVHWMDNYWLITEKDADTTIYEKGLMVQCNHILHWISDDGIIHEQWCVITDSTKYMTGEFEDRQFVVTRPDSRIAMTIARNKDTVKFSRLSRFLIDDPESPLKLSYQLSKPVKLGSVYNDSSRGEYDGYGVEETNVFEDGTQYVLKHLIGDGVYVFVLQEVNSTADDNHELGIADYYKFFPRKEKPDYDADDDHPEPGEEEPEDQLSQHEPDTGKKGWL